MMDATPRKISDNLAPIGMGPARVMAGLPPSGIARQARKKLQVLCPVCGDALDIWSVNISRCTRVGGAWKTSAMCRNRNCLFTELSVKTMNDWRK